MRPQVKGGCTCDVDGWPCPDCQERFCRRSTQIRMPYRSDRWHLMLLFAFLVLLFPDEAYPILGSLAALTWWLCTRTERRTARTKSA